MKADAETSEPLLIGEMVQPVVAATLAQIDEGALNDSRTYKCNWRKLRYLEENLAGLEIRYEVSFHSL